MEAQKATHKIMTWCEKNSKNVLIDNLAAKDVAIIHHDFCKVTFGFAYRGERSFFVDSDSGLSSHDHDDIVFITCTARVTQISLANVSSVGAG